MKNSVKKLIVSLMAIAMFVYVGVTVFVNQSPVDAVSVEITATEINDNYSSNEKVAFPLSVDVEYNGTTKTATDGVIVYPSGKIVKITENAFAFAELGEYKIKYFFKDGSATVTAEKTFKVSSDLYYLTSESGTITPVTAEMNAASEYLHLEDDTMRTEREGLILRLSEGCAFKYNKPINLKDADEYGFADIISIDSQLVETLEINNTVYTAGRSVAKLAKIKLTDCYDPGIFVEIILESSGGGTLYTRVGTNHQTNGGIYYPNSAATSGTIKEYYVGGLRGVCRLDHGGQWGHGFGQLARGYNGNPVGALNFYYDYENQRVYAAGGSRKREDAVIVNDLISPAIYGTNLFQGFTTGEVFLSIECSSYELAQPARLNVLSVGNDEGNYLVKSYKDSPEYIAYEDEVAPAIQLPGVNIDRVYCEKGDTFIIPKAVAYDVNLLGGVEVRVYRNYDSANKASVSIDNGAFAVNAVDTYYIEYSAVDKYGNKGVKVFKVYGVDTGAGKSLSVATEKLTTMDAGALITLPVFTVSTVNDPTSVKLDIVAKCDRETIAIGSYEGLDNINAAAIDGIKFTPKYAGEYTISYILKDSVYDQTESPFEYKVTCKASNVVSFLDTPFLERYLIKNATYGLKEFTAYEFTQGEPNAKKVDAYISFDGGEFTKIADINRVLITGNETAQVKYAVNDDNYILSDVVEIVDVNYGDYTIKMNKYFQYEEGAFTVEEVDEDGWELSEIVYKSTKTEGDNKLSFVNSLFYENFTFQYLIDSSYDKFDSISLILTDVKDPTYVTKITVGRKNTASYVSINDGLKNDYTLAFSGGQHTIAYNASLKKFIIGKTIIKHEVNFPSGRAYLDVVLNGIYGESGVAVKTVNNQKMLGDSHDDTNVPLISVKKTNGNFNVGDVVTIYAPDYADVLSPIDLSTIKYSVYCGETPVKSLDGVLLDGTNDPFKNVQIKLDVLGQYSVVYSAKDIYGQLASGRYYLSAVDTVAPSITVDDYEEGYIYNVKLGQKITFSYQVSDNVTPDEECLVGLTVTNMKTYSNTYWNRSGQEEGFVLGECSFFIVEEGLHRVDLLCRDAAGNYVYKTYQFMVKA